ncbi:hypothetical protein RCL_jg2553.t1 [Rhizophagus clarus]|uniref:Uncharacterized protein n=1 Tax=Rhizophagus clarus TaxID=94130 RepID=A0A8H3LLJ8_9GLOM|nr:hypothetical protein RCL_jg2553.t1 [Rhizophagus clarus]
MIPYTKENYAELLCYLLDGLRLTLRRITSKGQNVQGYLLDGLRLTLRNYFQRPKCPRKALQKPKKRSGIGARKSESNGGVDADEDTGSLTDWRSCRLGVEIPYAK